MTTPLGTARNPREVELKFHLPKGSRALLESYPALAAAAVEHSHLVSTYFDTPDQALDRCGLTLRVRRDGDSRIQNVKSRSDGHSVAASRGEWEWPIEQDTPQVACLEKTPLLSAAAKAIYGRLQPAFITNIRRTTRLIHLGEDTTVEVAFDEGDIEVGLTHEAVSELEIELKSGAVGPLYRLAAALLSTAPIWLMSESKASRGWRLVTGQDEGAQRVQPLKLNRKLCAASGFRQILGGALGQLTANIGPTLRGDPEGLHQARRAIRQVRAVLQLFGEYLHVDSAKRFKARLRAYGEILGAARDWDVFCLETLPAAMLDLPSDRLKALNAAAQAERQRAHEAVATAVRARAFSELILGLTAWSDVGAIDPSHKGAVLTRQRLSALAPSLLDRAARTARRRAQHIGQLSQGDRHRLRKSLKKLIFDVDALARFCGTKGHKRYQRRCEALEKVLGVANDAVVTNRLAHSLVTADQPNLSNPASALERWNTQRDRKVLEGLKAVRSGLRNVPTFWS